MSTVNYVLIFQYNEILSDYIATLGCKKKPGLQLKKKSLPFRSNQDGTCRSWYGGDVDHRRYRDHQDAYGAYLNSYHINNVSTQHFKRHQ